MTTLRISNTEAALLLAAIVDGEWADTWAEKATGRTSNEEGIAEIADLATDCEACAKQEEDAEERLRLSLEAGALWLVADLLGRQPEDAPAR